VGQDPGLLNARDGAAWTPLMHASQEGHLEVVRWLVDKGAATNERDDIGFTALHLACRNGHGAVVRLLVEKGADPATANVHKWTPLMGASSGGHLEVVRFLLGLPSAKASINDRDEFDRTALWKAANGAVGGS
jgi:ankyrin repeat protein